MFRGFVCLALVFFYSYSIARCVYFCVSFPTSRCVLSVVAIASG